jgi:hypothetical protein
MRKLARRWADGTLRRDNERTAIKCDELESRLRIQQLELDELAAVVQRNLKRVESETAIHSRRIADCEGTSNVSTY